MIFVHTFVSLSTVLAIVLYNHQQQKFNMEHRIHLTTVYFHQLVQYYLCLCLTYANMHVSHGHAVQMIEIIFQNNRAIQMTR